MKLLLYFCVLIIVSTNTPAFANESDVSNQSTAKFVTASTVKLGNPHDLKLSPDGKYLFVADVDNNRVVILDPETLAYVAEFGSDHQSGTHDIDFDQQGRAYVADTYNGRIIIYKIEDTSAIIIGGLSEHIRGPEGILVHPNGRIYVAGAWSNNGRPSRTKAPNGSTVHPSPGGTTSKCPFKWRQGLALLPRARPITFTRG